MAPTHASLRKLRRKIQQDGFLAAGVSSMETLYRREILPPVFRILADRQFVQILDEEELTEAANDVAQIEYEGTDESRRVFEVGEGTIVPETGLCLAPGGRLVSASVSSPEYSERYTVETLARTDVDVAPVTPKLLSKAEVFEDATEIEGPVCPLAPRYRNYYHWIVGTIPKIRYVERYEALTGQEVTYILPRDLPPWAREILSLLGYSGEKFVAAKSDAYQTNQLIVPSHPFPGQREDYEWLRERVFDTLELPAPASVKNIYISREKAVGRRVVNQDEVVRMLSEYGFEKYVLEDRNVRENIALFAQADLVVSPHGAGLTDIMFCRDSSVVELFGARKNTAYEQLCSLLDFNHVALDCEAVSTDIRVDVGELEDTVEQLY